MRISDKAYNIIKSIVVYLISPLATFCVALSQVWGFDYGEEISATIVSIGTFLAGIIGLSNAGYNTNYSNYDGDDDDDE